MVTAILIVFAAVMLIGVSILVFRSGNSPRKNQSSEGAVNSQQQTPPTVTRSMGRGDD